MRFLSKIALYLSFLSLLASGAVAQKKATPKRFFTAGFYSGIEMTSKDSGDYGGIAVYLTQSANDTFALVTTAEGAIFEPVLVKARMSGKDMPTIEFTLPGDNGEKKFKGTVNATGMTIKSGTTSPRPIRRLPIG